MTRAPVGSAGALSGPQAAHGPILVLQRAVALVRAGVGLAEVAARAGYADQPHLSREVRALAGVSPSQLRG